MCWRSQMDNCGIDAECRIHRGAQAPSRCRVLLSAKQECTDRGWAEVGR